MSARYLPPSFPGQVELDLSRNEGRLAGSVSRSIPDDWGEAFRRYPDLAELELAIANRHGLDPSRVLATGGSDDALFRAILAFRDRPIVTTTPTFEMIARYSQQVGAGLIEVPWLCGAFPVDAFKGMSGERAVAIVVSPNNPTGATISVDDLSSLGREFEIVVLDAAYADFADLDLTEHALSHPNVVVLRTLSKSYGMAGARVGYALGTRDTISFLGAVGNPYSVSGPSARLAVTALESGGPDIAFIDEVRSERTAIAALLESLGAEPLPSQANFVAIVGTDPAWLVAAMASLGVGVRSFPHRVDLETAVRVTLPGGKEDFDRLCAVLRAAFRPQALLFDLDGVIADVSFSFDVAIIQTAASFGVGVSRADIEEARSHGNANDDWELTRRLLTHRGVDTTFAMVVDRFESIYQGTRRAPGVWEQERLLVDSSVLAGLSNRLPLGIVTGRPRRDAERFLDRFGITGLFSTVVTRDEAPLKPRPEPVALALQDLGVESAWMLGDTADDITAAKQAGVVPIGVIAPGATRERTEAVLNGAARILGSVSELEVMLDAQGI